jgi:ferredoxin
MTRQKRRVRFFRPSTQAFFDEAQRTPGFSLLDRLHGYVYARWPYLYIGIGTRQHPLARILAPVVGLVGRLRPPPATDAEPRTFADGYLGDLEQTIPYPMARDIVLKNPEHIAVLECPCRAVRPDPCQPLDVCLIIGEPFASFILEHHPRRSRSISQAEAVNILRAEHQRGHVHHAFFKDAMLGRFYAICNCCACCCGAMSAWQNGTPMLASSGYVAVVDSELCAACGSCADSCQFNAISVDNSRAVVDVAACMGCGVCVSQCPEGAFSLVRDPAKGEPLEIRELIAQAATQARTAS